MVGMYRGGSHAVTVLPLFLQLPLRGRDPTMSGEQIVLHVQGSVVLEVCDCHLDSTVQIPDNVNTLQVVK